MLGACVSNPAAVELRGALLELIGSCTVIGGGAGDNQVRHRQRAEPGCSSTAVQAGKCGVALTPSRVAKSVAAEKMSGLCGGSEAIIEGAPFGRVPAPPAGRT